MDLVRAYILTHHCTVFPSLADLVTYSTSVQLLAVCKWEVILIAELV